ncbi:hypothetical protein [Planctomyces sp. SH-PL14]|uniref:hypothetical protein n=1 Tax=Planctomyces sp. SH-PL14 TaxID=1632864 RepID=UPI00078D416C|nr:hypothetical protein [Planctomyces sp. SH-PL14]AMV16748.1 hypothetical protein VT03_02585 [Planctomyces sp. SH-PL14]
MSELLVLAAGLIVCLSAGRAFLRSRDPLCPAVIFAPMLVYIYSYHPLTMISSGSLAQFFPDPGRVDYVLMINLLSLLAFCAGLQAHQAPVARGGGRLDELMLSGSSRRRMIRMGFAIGTVAVGVFVSMVWATGPGLWRMAKPFLSSPIDSGYYRELPNLAFPAAFLVALGWGGTRLTPGKFLTLLYVLSPMIAWSIIGGRRGPMFLSAATLAGGVVIIRRKIPNIASVLAGLGLAGVLMLLLVDNRSLLRPWTGDVQTDSFVDTLTGDAISEGDEFVVAMATILASDQLERNYWGARYFVQFFIRPIPQELWPTKYRDCDMEWMQTAAGSSGIGTGEWMSEVGFVPYKGSSMGFIADLFLEFHAGCIAAVYLIGHLYSLAWQRSRVRRGLWTILYFEMLILSIYLPTQSIGAWLYRLLILAVPTLLLMGYLAPRLASRRRAPAIRTWIPSPA